MESDAPHTDGGESGTVGQYEGVHRGDGRHKWNPIREVSGAVRVPVGDLKHTNPKEN